MRALALAVLLSLAPIAALAAEQPPDAAQARAWLEEWKNTPRGPFSAIRWFCGDGTVHPPKPYPCKERGEGQQHGLLDPRLALLRQAGFPLAPLLVEVDPQQLVDDPEALRALLVERFLLEWEDGWYLRRARTYRGAIQVEDEEQAAGQILAALLASPAWHTPARFVLLRETARLLPLQSDLPTATRVRALASQIAEDDPGFGDLRTRIHGAPTPGDAERVRTYARRAPERVRARIGELAGLIDAQFERRDAARDAEAAAGRLPDAEAAQSLRRAAQAVRGAGEDTAARLSALGSLLAELRDAFAALLDASGEAPSARRTAAARALLTASLASEEAYFATAQAAAPSLPDRTRRELLGLVDASVRAVYGAGLITRRHWAGVVASLASIDEMDSTLGAYRREVGYLARAPEWASRWLDFHFAASVDRLAQLEEAARLYPQDRLRASPLLFLGNLLDRLSADASQLAGATDLIFEQPAPGALRALNPGLARGRLVAAEHGEEGSLPPDAIALLPETTADLPPVAGILTLGEGNSLSHVQLLARNLGVPNAVIRGEAIETLRQRLGERVVLAVSQGGIVRIHDDSPRFDAIFSRPLDPSELADSSLRIEPDLEKLDLTVTQPASLADIGSTDSGRISGPKGANLGQLRRLAGDAVPAGFVIPFGAFRKLLDRPLEPGGPRMFDWMRAQYGQIRALTASEERRRTEAEFLARVRQWIETEALDPELEAEIRQSLAALLGPGETGQAGGVFVRSDTNVEDLPGFTGAGLNLTVPNVVGTDAILRAIRDVWASPFTERAYAWRQAHMDQPEYVFPAVVVQRAFAAEKSGVLVSIDVDTGERGWLSVATNEGVGGAVEGQFAEALRVPLAGGRVRFLAQATARERAVLDPAGGMRREPASGSDAVLLADEVLQLVALASSVRRFPALQAAGADVPADIEFAFRDGKLALLQLRPFVESRRARKTQLLIDMDVSLEARSGRLVPLDERPRQEDPP